MKKRGQMQQGEFLKYIIGIIVLGMIFLFAYSSVQRIKNSKCETEYAAFFNKFSSASSGLIFNEARAKSFDLPCGSDKIVFVDSDINEPLVTLNDYPLINDALETGSANIFLFSDGMIKKSFSLKRIKVGFPYFACYSSDDNKLKVVLESEENQAKIVIKDNDADCTNNKPISVEMKPEDIESITKELKDEGLEIDESKIITEDECLITRSFENEGGSVEVTISKEGVCTAGDFVFFESIPKCAINSLQDAIDQGKISLDMEGWEIVKDDPLLKWSFDPSKDDDYTYIIKKIIEEGCKKDFKGFGVSHEGITLPPPNEPIVPKDTTSPNILGNNPPITNNPPQPPPQDIPSGGKTGDGSTTTPSGNDLHPDNTINTNNPQTPMN